jgi:PAS domain-containing protein
MGAAGDVKKCDIRKSEDAGEDFEERYWIHLNQELETQREKLRESEQRFATFMSHMPLAAWLKDLQVRYVYANPGNCQCLIIRIGQ